MSFEMIPLKNNGIKVQKCTPKNDVCHFNYVGGRVNAITLQSMIANGYEKKPQNKHNIDGYILDKELSGTRAQVYHNPETNHLVINHRGTKGMQDVFTDIGLMFNHKSGKRFQHGKAVTDAALRKYDTENVTLSGHSLAGVIATEVNKKHGKETVIVNGAVTPYDMFNKQDDKTTVVRSKLDPISYLHSWSPFANKAQTIDIEAKSYNPFTEHSADVLERLGDTDIGTEN